ncbi:MAG: Phosphopantetheine adenylyltransferase, partial [uncultured Gemmatimonadaceae bacterium]
APHRHLRRQLRPDHPRARRPHAPQPHLRRPARRRGGDELGEAAAVHDGRAHRVHPPQRRRRAAGRGPHVRRAPGGVRAERGRAAHHPRPARGERLRVRVPDGAHEPPPPPRDRDGVHGAVTRLHVHQLQPGARGGAARRRRDGARPPRGRRRAARQVRTRRRRRPV